jgi:hypothetical protein
MIRRRLATAAIALYPPNIRVSRGQEILGTLLDAGSESRTAFVREIASISLGGLLARSRVAYERPSRSIASNILAAAALMWLADHIAFDVQWFVQDPKVPDALTFMGWADVLIPALVLVLVLARSDRLAGALGLAWIGLDLFHYNPGPTAYIFDVAPALIFTGMILAPDKTTHGWRPIVWLLPGLLWGFSVVTGRGLTNGIGFITPPILALGFVALDPAFAIGTALTWTFFGISGLTINPSSVPADLQWASCAPLALLLAATCKRAMRSKAAA